MKVRMHTEGTLRDGQYWQAWTDDGAPVRGVVVLVHGVHEHGGRYAHVGARLAAAGYPVYAVDHPGHGRSPGTRGNIGSMEETVAGVDAVARLAAERHPGVPVFVYGHSLGGLIALQYITGTPIELRGAVLSAPAVDVNAGNPMQRAASGLLSRFTPNLGVMRIDPATISRDPDVVRDYRTDPLNHVGKLRARTGAEILRTTLAMQPRLEALRLPLLLIHGSADKLVSPSTTEFVAAHAGTADLTVKVYDRGYHESHNEPNKDAVLDDIVAWLAAHS
ncbi:MAG TPA: lysophospholipase [Jatrophihabitantaceae bacterium]|jgi:alpha-beta hydrolase superfamily lysophospholipase|nr:lysophospholipase [Jatrophihabitantaceae bacterium]